MNQQTPPSSPVLQDDTNMSSYNWGHDASTLTISFVSASFFFQWLVALPPCHRHPPPSSHKHPCNPRPDPICAAVPPLCAAAGCDDADSPPRSPCAVPPTRHPSRPTRRRPCTLFCDKGPYLPNRAAGCTPRRSTLQCVVPSRSDNVPPACSTAGRRSHSAARP